MKTTAITVPYPADKLDALRQYAAKKGVSVDAELTGTLDRMYEKIIPAAVREYIASKPETEPSVRPPRPARPRSSGGE